MKFVPCTGDCTEGGTHCQGCGRSHTEIEQTRKLVMALVDFANAQEYENKEEFANSIHKNLLKKLLNP